MTRDFQQRYGPWALITGASAGIGAEFAHQLAARGLNLCLCARRGDRLSALAAELRERHQVETLVVPVDLARPDFMDALVPALGEREVGLLVSNAGYALTGGFLKHELAEELALFDTNCRSPLILAHHLARQMAARRRGGVIMVSSVVGFMAVPYWTGYAASKAHNLFIAEGLRHELKDVGVDVLALCPSGTATEFQQVAGTQGARVVSAEVVVRAALDGLGKRAVVLPGPQAKLVYAASRLLPRGLLTRAGAQSIQKQRIRDER